jgi:hypothetical protein
MKPNDGSNSVSMLGMLNNPSKVASRSAAMHRNRTVRVVRIAFMRASLLPQSMDRSGGPITSVPGFKERYPGLLRRLGFSSSPEARGERKPPASSRRACNHALRRFDRFIGCRKYISDFLAEAVEDGDAGGGEQGDQEGILDERGTLLVGGELVDGDDKLGHGGFSCCVTGEGP